MNTDAPGAVYDDAPQPKRWPGAPSADEWAIGAIMFTVDDVNPEDRIGYGTWALFGEGRMPVAYKSGDPNFGTAGATGGAKTVDDHAHHTHSVSSGSGDVQSGAGATVVTSVSGSTGSESPTLTHKQGGLSTILPPYIVVFMWERTA